MAVAEPELRAAMCDILNSNELSQLTSRIVRSKLEERFGVDFRERKKELDDMLLEMIEEQQAKDGNDSDGEDDQKNVSDDESNLEQEAEGSCKEQAQEINDEELARKLQNNERSLRKRQTVKERSTPKAKPNAGEKKGSRKGTGFGKPMVLSEQLAAVVGENRMSRSDVVKKMWEVIRERKLEDPKNKRYTICDKELQLLFGRKRIQTFGMMKYLKRHIKDPSLL